MNQWQLAALPYVVGIIIEMMILYYCFFIFGAPYIKNVGRKFRDKQNEARK